MKDFWINQTVVSKNNSHKKHKLLIFNNVHNYSQKNSLIFLNIKQRFSPL